MNGITGLSTGVRAVLKNGRIVFLNNTSATEITFLLYNKGEFKIGPLEASENGDDFQISIEEIEYILED